MSEEFIVNKEVLRRFGLTMAVMFAMVFGGFFPFIFSRPFPLWPFIVALCFLLPGLIYPLILKPIYIIWMKIGESLGWVNSRIILGIMFFGIFTPIGLIMKIFRRDTMKKQKVANTTTYRILRENQQIDIEVPY